MTFKEQLAQLAKESESEREFNEQAWELINQQNKSFRNLKTGDLASLHRASVGQVLDLGMGYSVIKKEPTGSGSDGRSYDQYEIVMPDGSRNQFVYRGKSGQKNFNQQIIDMVRQNSGLPDQKRGKMADSLARIGIQTGWQNNSGYERSGTSGYGSNIATYSANDRASNMGGSRVYGNDVQNKKANNAAVNTLYQAYFGRNASSAELKNWGEKGGSDTTGGALENFLQKERTKYGINSEIKTLDQVKNSKKSSSPEELSLFEKSELDKLNSDIDAMGLSFEEKAILKQIASEDFTSGNKIPSTVELQNIIDVAARNAAADLTPYYQKIGMRELEDMKNKMEDIRTQVSNYVASETSSYRQKVAETKQNLRSRGLTFSGYSRGQLGSEGAIESGGIEGAIPEERRLGYAEEMQKVGSAAREIGIAAERNLGSAGLRKVSVQTPYGTTNIYNPKKLGQEGYIQTGDFGLDRLKAIEQSKWDRVSKYRSYL